MEFNAIKFNYKNGVDHISAIKIIDEKLFYKSKKGKWKEMKNIIGAIHGPITYTWNFDVIWRKHKINNILCVSFISRERTYDFIFERYSKLNHMFLLIKHLLITNYTKEYLTYCIKLCKTTHKYAITGKENWKNLSMCSKWNFILNKPKQEYIKYNELNDEIKTSSINNYSICCTYYASF